MNRNKTCIKYKSTKYSVIKDYYGILKEGSVVTKKYLLSRYTHQRIDELIRTNYIKEV